jgi:hypothetical protein
MKVLNLACDLEHGFEGWFASEDDFQSQCARKLVQCPMCGSDRVHKLPSAPRLNLGSEASMQTSVLQVLRQLMDKTEDVGPKFAEEARRIHHGEAPQRDIRGVATKQETAELLEEGIGVMALPLPESMKTTLQ